MPTLQFKGKPFVQNHHLTVPYHELIYQKQKSLNGTGSLDDNLIIHGDNLKALKALLPIYAGKIKCIYIDAPYNTGNENWVYNDSVNSPMMQEWLGKVVDKDDLTRHDKWLCMMMPRLKLLRELLCDDGVIFVSIDDNEMYRLREVMNEVFGEQNFVATFVWKRRASSALAEKFVSVDHEYILAYHGGKMDAFAGIKKDFNAYSNPDNDPNGDWTLGDLTVGMNKDQRPNQFYDLVNPKTGRHFKGNPNRVWAFIRTTMKKEIAEGRVLFPENPNGRPMVKRYRKNLKSNINPVSTWIRCLKDVVDEEDVVTLRSGLTSEGGKALQEIFGTVPFNYSKPPSLIMGLVEQVLSRTDIILDAFGGSGTTAHAVLAANKEDNGNRKFILVECEDYADKITAERVRRVIKGVPSAKDKNLKKGLGGSFSYFELGDAMDVGEMLSGKKLPSYKELARYVFHTATGEPFDDKAVDEKKNFIGESKNFLVYLFYSPKVEDLKNLALTLDIAKSLKPDKKEKRKLVFAPAKYLDQEFLDRFGIDFAQLPFEIYQKIK